MLQNVSGKSFHFGQMQQIMFPAKSASQLNSRIEISFLNFFNLACTCVTYCFADPVLPNGSSEETIRKTEEYAEKVENQNMKYQCAWHQLSADKEAAHLEVWSSYTPLDHG